MKKFKGDDMMKYEYHGVIIEEALDDNRFINALKVEKVHITGHKKRNDRRHYYQVNISLEQIETLSNHIKEDFYLYFWKDNHIIALFSGKKFEFDYLNKDTWTDVLAYAHSIGFEESDLDFSTSGL